MIDPFTAMAAATAAFNGIKKAVAVGKDVAPGIRGVRGIE